MIIFLIILSCVCVAIALVCVIVAFIHFNKYSEAHKEIERYHQRYNQEKSRAYDQGFIDALRATAVQDEDTKELMLAGNRKMQDTINNRRCFLEYNPR